MEGNAQRLSRTAGCNAPAGLLQCCCRYVSVIDLTNGFLLILFLSSSILQQRCGGDPAIPWHQEICTRLCQHEAVMCGKCTHCSMSRELHTQTAYQNELLNAAVQEDAQEVPPCLGAAGTCQVPGNFMCASKGLQLVRVELDSRLSIVFCLNTLQAAGSYWQPFILELCASIFALWVCFAMSFSCAQEDFMIRA